MKYIYLDTSVSRLVISDNEIVKENFIMLLIISNNNKLHELEVAKFFCMGYIMGNNSVKVINDPSEFK